ncbi:MAG TPA: TadE/TadG family type IV pilus assembly protein [Caulobacteraceae bacterium]|jgi:Flp pilus assembly protein TadG|nr:TadE/TadG family type IV pilus assembly protein [Caulobacteraceae bacterium]
MSPKPPAPGRLRSLAARFAAARRGAAALEFALLAIPFLALTFGIIEVGLIYFVATTLDAATSQAARQIRTGQLQSQGTPATPASFKALICDQLNWLGSNCANNLSIQVQTFSSFQTVSQPSPIQNGAIDQANLAFNMGGPGDIVLVQSFYQWTVLAPGLDDIGTPLSGGKTLLTSTAVFRNEPYGS